MESSVLHSPFLSSTSFSRVSIHHLQPRLSTALPRISSSLKPPLLSISAPKFSLQNFSHSPPKLLYKKLSPPHSSTNDNAPSTTELKTVALQGAKIIPLIISVSIGLIVRFLVPKPPEVTPQAWQLLSIFLSTIVGLVLSPLPVGAWAFLGLTTSILTRTLPFTIAFSAFTNEVIWLIVISFFFARGFVKTGLRDRIATYFVKWLGKSTLELSYGLTLSEATLFGL